MQPPAVALIVGDGVGAEVIPSVLEVLAASGAEFDFRRVDISAVSAETPENYLDQAVSMVRECGIGLKTRITGDTRDAPWHSAGNTAANPNVELRTRLDLYAGVRPIKSLTGLPTRYPDLDLLLIRENTEDIYKGIEHEVVPSVVESLKVVTRRACERIARYAFRIATEHRREKLTFIHKANIMKRSDGLFRRIVASVAEDFPSIDYEDRIVDAACMQLVLDPYRFDLILTGNLYGDILSSLGSGLVGGVSNAHAINVGDELRVFEALHGDSRAGERRDSANPLPVLSAAIALIRHFEQDRIAQDLTAAICTTLEAGTTITPDLGGSATTEEMCRAIVSALP